MKIYPKFTQNFEADKADNSTSRTNRNTMIHMTATTYPGAYRSYSKRPHHSIASGAAHVLIIGSHCGRGQAPISKKKLQVSMTSRAQSLINQNITLRIMPQQNVLLHILVHAIRRRT